jgi:hypothetical protein
MIIEWKGEGKIMENWTDEPCFYASVQDAGKTGLLLGPFKNEKDCRGFAYYHEEDGGNHEEHSMLQSIAEKCDPRSVFYAFGMVKLETGRRSGVLNKFFEPIGFGFKIKKGEE